MTCTLVFTFDNTALFRLLPGEEDGAPRAYLSVVREAARTALRITIAEEPPCEPPLPTGEAVGATMREPVLLSLPPVAIDGSPESILLSLRGDGSGCGVFLEAADALGWGVAYRFPPIDFHGWRTLEVEVPEPAEYFGSRLHESDRGIVTPLQLCHIGVERRGVAGAIDVVLESLHVTGAVRLTPPGIA